MSERKAVIKNADMSEEMQHACIDCAAQAMERFNIEKDIAACAYFPPRAPANGHVFGAPRPAHARAPGPAAAAPAPRPRRH